MTWKITIDEAVAWARNLPRQLVPAVLREAAGVVRYALQEHFKKRQAEPRKDGFPAQGFWVGSRDAGARVATDAEVPVTDSRFGLVVKGDLTDGADYVFAFDMLDAAGNPMTVTKTARFSAS